MPNSKEIEGNWNELKGKLKQKYRLTMMMIYTTKEKKMKCVNYKKISKTEKKLNHYLINF
jgi:hypothetical protein